MPGPPRAISYTTIRLGIWDLDRLGRRAGRTSRGTQGPRAAGAARATLATVVCRGGQQRNRQLGAGWRPVSSARYAHRQGHRRRFTESDDALASLATARRQLSPSIASPNLHTNALTYTT